MMLANPATKYVPFAPFARDFSERTWPSRRITQPPIWMSTDLRDGNQSLIEPMSVERKLRFFEQLVKIGFKEIEVGFPSASQTDFDFVRKLVDEKRIPDDVTIIVLTQSREDLISRTVEAAAGARQAMVHLYNACAPAFRKVVFNMSKDEIKQIAVTGTQWVKQYMARHPETDWRYEYSPEVFSTTEPEFALEVSNAVADVWQPTPQKKMVLNLPATVEATTPNLYADQIEWMHKNLARRDSIVLSVHPHNDRGTAVAAAEFAVMAGADRIEGCLFGSGERTGNVDLVTLALNLYTQGVHPGLDFSDIDEVRRCAEYCNQLPVHPRHPYAGDLVFTAFSGSHQDAIKKGFAQQKPDAVWEVPYLPIDPADLGRSYDAVIRVNSQSGKGGVSYLLEQEHGLVLPRRLQIEFSRAIQRVTDETGREVTADDVHTIFNREYLEQHTPWKLVRHRIDGDPAAGQGKQFSIQVELDYNGERRVVTGTGDGAISAFVAALDVPVRIMDYHEHAIGTGTDTRAASYVELRVGDSATGFGVGIDSDIVTASFRAVLSAVNRHLANGANVQSESETAQAA
ncbi:2-isopropylmalate synthase [Bordetella petrii]|uniref:2-isopropylmalate synthase n=1 Tax=Bordetella petrii TaxID=94624 RepID=UPI0038B3512E